jgi:uncharacterized protein (TIGR02246 family)
MKRNKCVPVAVLAVFAVAAAVGLVYRSPARDESPRAESTQDAPAIAAIRKTAGEFAEAFNKGDAKALAAFWTKEGEYIGPDGETLRGRDAIEKEYVEFFKNHPKAKIAVHVESVRLLGRHTALEEGMLKLLQPGEKEPGTSRYSVLHIREDDGWRMASVREWVPDPASLVTVKDLEWLIGEWVARSGETEVRTVYEWDTDKAILRCRYTLKKDGKVTSSGTQFIAKKPAGGLRSWLVDSSGAVGDSLWSRDEDRWVVEASGTLPDGSEVTAVNILIPVGKDAFTWQSTERTAAGSPLPDVPPVKVTRVKADK